jgi:hypothetical protein
MAFDELQRILDANSNRIINVGSPTTANDATITDNSTAPQNPAASASAGSSFLAAPRDHVHQGVHSLHADSNANIYGDARLVSGTGITLTQSGNDITVATSGGNSQKLHLSKDGQNYVTGTSEQIVAEWYANFASLPVGNIQVRLSGIVKVSGGNGTYKCYVGATSPGATTGGTARATISSISGTSDAVATNQGSAFTNPAGQALVQVTAVSDTGGQSSTIRGTHIEIG